MSTMQEQLDLEDTLIELGAERYRASISKTEKDHRGADTGYGSRLIEEMVVPVADCITEIQKKNTCVRGKYIRVVASMDAFTTAFIGLKVVMSVLQHGQTATAVSAHIGRMLEDELRFSDFKKENTEYFNSVDKDFKRRKVQKYSHIRNALSVVSQKKGHKWETWSAEQRVSVGALVLDCILDTTGLIRLAKKRITKGYSSIVLPTDEATDWINRYNDHASIMHPFKKPCVVQPADWTGVQNGGYWSARMRNLTPFVIGAKGFHLELLRDNDLTRVFSAVNAMQRTAWQVDEGILDVVLHAWNHGWSCGLPGKEPINIPKFDSDTRKEDMDDSELARFKQWKTAVSKLYTEEEERASRSYEVARVLQMASTFKKYPAIWFVFQCDFRGRVYASTSGLNPQGSDFNKAMLRFRDGKPLGERGLYWLKVHGANTFGFDKVSFEDRVKWVEDHEDDIIKAGNDPIECNSLWRGADKPFQFLAFCREYAKAHSSGDPYSFVSALPVGMDGSCNGLQNFSALLRDPVGAAATNLAPSKTPADVYQEVSDRALEIIVQQEPTYQQDRWLKFAKRNSGLSRKISKRPVMTLVYACTKYTCVNFVQAAVNEIEPGFVTDNAEAQYIGGTVWDAVGDIVVAAKDAMQWLQDVSKLVTAEGFPIWWITPIGLPVLQNKKRNSYILVKTLLAGNVRLTVAKPTEELCKRKQSNGIAPNFIHSLDSSHMMFTINACEKLGVTQFAMIHDDFGTVAADIDTLRGCIKGEFVRMYTNFNPLKDFRDCCAMSVSGELPPVPESGDFDINEVLKSDFFFS